MLLFRDFPFSVHWFAFLFGEPASYEHRAETCLMTNSAQVLKSLAYSIPDKLRI